MSKKFIEIKEGIYVVTNGNFKIVKGDFTEESLNEINELSQKIETINEEKEYYEKEMTSVQIMNKIAKKSWVMRILPACGFIFTIITNSTVNLVGLICLLAGYAGLQLFLEKALRMICGTKKEREEREKSATTMLESLNHHLKVHEKTLEEKTQYKEIPYEGDRIVKPVFDMGDKTRVTSLSPKQEQNSEDILFTDKEIHRSMQMPETSPAPLILETIYGEDEESIKENGGPGLVKKRIPPKKPNNN